MAEQQLIIIKKSDDHDDHDHHGGGWKVAYADFMTAMMAFFLLLWIISAADEKKLKGLAEFFTPTDKTEILGGEGFLDGQVFGPDGVYSGVDGQSFQIQPPSFGSEPPVSPKGEGGPDQSPRVVVEYIERAVDDVDNLFAAAARTAGLDETEQADADLLAERELRDARLDEVAQEIETAVATNLALVELESNLRIDKTPDGLLIQILDQENRPMFASGSAKIDAATRSLVQIIALAVRDLAYPLAVTGHTDSVPFNRRSDYGNWELSADRANATRRALLEAGVGAARISRVSGMADTMPPNATSPAAPENRRITMLLIYPDPGAGSEIRIESAPVMAPSD